MFLQTVVADGQAELRFIEEMKARAEETRGDIEETVRRIMDDVRVRGMEAVEEYSKRYDKVKPFIVGREVIDRACAGCDPELRKTLEQAAENIRDYHEKMLAKSWQYERAPGAVLGQMVRGMHKVGLYVPGGTAAYPSSVLMSAIPAKVAGVEELVIVTPPTENLSVEVLTAARIAGVDTIIAVGGTQAIAALAYGAGFIPRVDKIVGPGNAYVAAAKKLAFGMVDIDMIAGPSEVLVIADHTANPSYVAADLLSQAEHDRLASAVLLTDSMAQAHLEIVTANPRELLPYITDAGAVFLGQYSPEPLGDYMAGPSHVLPTSGTARFFSPLSTDTFLKKTSVIEYSRGQLEALSGGIIQLAQAEKLDAHANAVRIRFSEEG